MLTCLLRIPSWLSKWLLLTLFPSLFLYMARSSFLYVKRVHQPREVHRGKRLLIAPNRLAIPTRRIFFPSMWIFSFPSPFPLWNPDVLQDLIRCKCLKHSINSQSRTTPPYKPASVFFVLFFKKPGSLFHLKHALENIFQQNKQEQLWLKNKLFLHKF